MPIISRSKARFYDDNQDEIKPETFGIKYNENYDSIREIPNQNKSYNNLDEFDNEETNYKFWILTVVFILLPSILIARSPLIKINFNNTIKANYIELPDLEPLTGNLSPNKLLEKAKFIGLHQIKGPECIVFDKQGNLYTGLVNGSIIKIDKHDRKNIKVLTHIGEETNKTLCNSSLFGNPKCGRPLGLRLDKEKNLLYVADAFYGIFKINILTGEKYLVLSSSDPRFGTARPKLVNDLDIDSDMIYFIDSSYERDYSEFLEEHVEALSRGRLFRYNQTNNELEFLIENLYFPNGLQLTPNKDAVLINENTMARIIKFYLKGEKKNKKEIFVDLPGFGDNIRLSSHQTYFVPIVLIRHKPSILGLFGQYPLIRTFLGYILDFTKVLDYLPKYGLVIEYDLNGNPLKSWHDPTGKLVKSITHAELYEKKLYLGSFQNDYIAVVDY